jgi:hypothetical protein
LKKDVKAGDKSDRFFWLYKFSGPVRRWDEVARNITVRMNQVRTPAFAQYTNFHYLGLESFPLELNCAGTQVADSVDAKGKVK